MKKIKIGVKSILMNHEMLMMPGASNVDRKEIIRKRSTPSGS